MLAATFSVRRSAARNCIQTKVTQCRNISSDKEETVKNFFVLNHPLIQRDLTILRDKKTSPELFRAVLHRISICLAYEVLKDMSLTSIPIETPLTKTKGMKLKEEVILVPILRAGLGLVNGFQRHDGRHSVVEIELLLPGQRGDLAVGGHASGRDPPHEPPHRGGERQPSSRCPASSHSRA